MDPIKEAFSKAKQDIFNLQSQLENMRRDMQEIKRILIKISENQKSNQPTNQQTNQQSNFSNSQNAQYGLIPSETSNNPTIQQQNTSFQHINPTQNSIPTHNLPQYGLIPSKKETSIGNEGVPTNQPTNQQTNQHIGNEGVISFPMKKLSPTITEIEK